MTSTGRVARLTALALATGTLVAAGAGTAGAATKTNTTYTATGGGSVLRLTVNLPVEVPGIGSSLTQDIVLTGGSARTGQAAAAIGNAVLGANGTVPVVSGLLEKSVTAEYGKPAPAAVDAFPAGLSALGITGHLLALNSTVANPNVDGTVSHSKSAVADLTIAGGNSLDAILSALNSQVQAILATALGTATQSQTDALGGVVAGVTTPVTGLLNTVTDTLDAATQNATKPLTDAEKAAVQTVITQLTNLPSLLTNTLKLQAADTSLLHVGLIESEQTVNRAAGVVTSTSSNKLLGLSVLGGLVTVDGLTSQATAALGNGLSKATADRGQNAILKAGVAGVLTAELGSDLGITLTGLPDALQGTVQGALDQITTLLNTVLGATLKQTKVGNLVQDQNHASSSVSAAELSVNPALPGVGTLFSKPLVDVSFVPAEADVVKAQSVTPTTVITPAKTGSQPKMAATGANFGLTAPIAISLMGLALVARRRRLAHLAG